MAGFEFTMREDPRNRLTKQFLAELPERIPVFLQQLVRNVATEALEVLLQHAPSDIEKYPDILAVRQLPSKDGWEIVGVLPESWVFTKRMRSVDVPRSVLYVDPKMHRGVAKDEGAALLARHNPWTLQTLPYEPSKKAARIFVRQAQERQVRVIEEERKRDLPAIKTHLRELGVQYLPRTTSLLVNRVTVDLAYEVMRREFGTNTKPVPHWRPMFSASKKLLKREYLRLAKDLINPNSGKFQSIKGIDMARPIALKRVQGFQDMIVKGSP